MSRDIGAEMTVTQTHVEQTDVGIRFEIATTEVKKDAGFLVAGIHTVPFGKPYIIAFITITPANSTTDRELMSKIWQSFHFDSEAR